MMVTVLPLKSGASCACTHGTRASVAAIATTAASVRDIIRRLALSLGAVYRLHHRRNSSALFEPALPRQRSPREEAECQAQYRTLLGVELCTEDLVIGRHCRSDPQFGHLSGQRVMFGIAQHAGDELGVALIPIID